MNTIDERVARAQDQRHLEGLTRLLRGALPAAPARGVEIGCGRQGGFVLALISTGYDAAGVDPEAPEGPAYHRTEFEAYPVPSPVDAVVASVSLHHLADLGRALDQSADALGPRGTVVVYEWAHEWFDESTARWCFDRLGPSERGQGWLHRHRESWSDAGKTWDDYAKAWVRDEDENLHRGDAILGALKTRFETRTASRTPYFQPYLDKVTQAEEQIAIDSGRIRPAGIRTSAGAGRKPEATTFDLGQ